MSAMLPPPDEMYAALVRRDTTYEGVFVVAVLTTGIFCRPSCPARKPKPTNVEYYEDAREAMLRGFRPCRRCRPLETLGDTPAWLRPVIDAVEADPTRRFRDADLRALDVEPARARRWFQRHHGLTFHAYARARRLSAALGRLRQGDDSLQTGLSAGYESASGFREAFGKLFGVSPGRADEARRLTVTRVTTPLGPMVAAADGDALYLLEFVDRRMLATQIDRLRQRVGATFVPGDNEILAATQRQLAEYFDRRRQTFDLPLQTPGTDFQREVWAGLQAIPFGQTRSYGEQARFIGRPDAVRAVGKANGDNRIAIVIPCHRVIGAAGKLVGYGGQLWRKKALLQLEGVAI
jgi:AraC family transcriptional regulator of adaptative response/methylated-DNA-[protein]-cysteine methyltransferase